jgi:hypothetical protein
MSSHTRKIRGPAQQRRTSDALVGGIPLLHARLGVTAACHDRNESEADKDQTIPQTVDFFSIKKGVSDRTERADGTLVGVGESEELSVEQCLRRGGPSSSVAAAGGFD